MAGVTSAGFETKTLDTILDEMKTSIRSSISSTLNLSSRSLLGQLLGVSASQISQVWEANEENYANRDIEAAAGASLAELVSRNGTTRRAATYSTVLMTCNLDAATYLAGSLVVHVLGDATLRFANDENVVSPGGSVVGIPFTAEEPGEVRANAGTLTVIADPIVGFNSATNPAEATLGLEEETDAELRARYYTELARSGSTTAAAIRVAVADVESVTFARVFENDTDATVDTIPPHAFEVLVQGGVDATIAAAILAVKPAGIQAFGSTTESVTDSQGNTYTIGFTRPSEVDMEVEVDVTALDGSYGGDTAVKQALTDWFDAQQTIGKDVIVKRLEAVVLAVAGVIDAEVRVDILGGTPVNSNYVVGKRAIALLDQGDITVSSALVSDHP